MNDSLFQSTIVHLSKKTKKTQLQHYIIPQHNAKQLYDAYQGLLNQQENKEKVIHLMEKAGMTHIDKIYNGPCKYEGLHIPGPGLCWRSVISSPSLENNKLNNKVVLIETNFHFEPIYWYFIDLKENMTSSSACAALLIDRMVNTHHHANQPLINSKTSPPSSSSPSSLSSLEATCSSNESSSSNNNKSSTANLHHLYFPFHSLLNKSKKHSFFHHHHHHHQHNHHNNKNDDSDTLLFIIGCPLPIQTNENEPITYLG